MHPSLCLCNCQPKICQPLVKVRQMHQPESKLLVVPLYAGSQIISSISQNPNKAKQHNTRTDTLYYLVSSERSTLCATSAHTNVELRWFPSKSSLLIRATTIQSAHFFCSSLLLALYFNSPTAQHSKWCPNPDFDTPPTKRAVLLPTHARHQPTSLAH